MIKAKDFWNYLCNSLEYRFFSGVPHIFFKQLYKKMNKSFLHYIPAVNANVAIGMVNGVRLTGMNGAAIMSLSDLETCLNSVSRFNFEYELPLVVISNKEKEGNFKNVAQFLFNNSIKVVDLSDNFTTDLDLVTDISNNLMTLLLVEEGIFI